MSVCCSARPLFTLPIGGRYVAAAEEDYRSCARWLHSKRTPRAPVRYPHSDPGTCNCTCTCLHLASASPACSSLLALPFSYHFLHWPVSRSCLGLPFATPNTTFPSSTSAHLAESPPLRLAPSPSLSFSLRWLLTATVVPLLLTNPRPRNCCMRLRYHRNQEPPRVRRNTSFDLFRPAMRRYAAATWLP